MKLPRIVLVFALSWPASGLADFDAGSKAYLVARCAQCGLEAEGGYKALCCCGVKTASGKRLGLVCRRNPDHQVGLWPEIVCEYVDESGPAIPGDAENIVAFCKRHNLSVNVFYGLVRRHKGLRLHPVGGVTLVGRADGDAWLGKVRGS